VSILIDSNTKVIVQGITGRDGSFHTAQMLKYGTAVMGGVRPGKGGQKVCSLPVFDTVREAVEKTGARCSIVFVPAKFAAGAVREAADGGITTIVCITEGVPVLDALRLCPYLKKRNIRAIGPNSPGVISPGKCKVGIMPGHIHKPGSVGVISRSGTLTYEVVNNLTEHNIGQSTCIGIGGDPIEGTSFVELLEMFEKDADTEAIILIGEIGGAAEERAAEYIKTSVRKKVIAFISGRTAPPEKRMGHAGAIISAGKGSAAAKIKALREAGAIVVDRPEDIPDAIKA
jgi:succinyl-CoA synthetase alpha subunit